MKSDAYLTIAQLTTAKYVEKKSSFLSFALPVESEQEVEELLKVYRKKYYDARHVCYAFRLFPDKSLFRFSDNGEPSGTAGKPILGTILSKDLTNVLVIVVRYFGGIKLGTSGLTAAYKFAAEQCLKSESIVERSEQMNWTFSFDYARMNDVMQAVKASDAKVVESQLDLECIMEISGARNSVEKLKIALKGKVDDKS